MSADEPIRSPRTIVEHESPVRRMLAEMAGLPDRSLGSLKEAQASMDGVVILDSDYGGQVLMVCPARLVTGSEDDLRQLACTFGGDEGAILSFEQLPVGARVPGGMGGGVVTDGIWIHETLRGSLDEVRIRDVIDGRRPPSRGGGRVQRFLAFFYLRGVLVWQAGRLLIGFLRQARHGDKTRGGPAS